MGTVARQEKIGDSSITLSFEDYQDFLDYQQKEREQDTLDVTEAANRRNEFVENFLSNKRTLILSGDEYYYLSCILGHLVPAGKISKSLLDKVSLYDLDCEDFDRISLDNYQIKLNENN